MSRFWPTGIQFTDVVIEPDVRICPLCANKMYICDHRKRNIYSLKSPLRLVCKLVHCSDKKCSNHHCTFSPLLELEFAMPGWKIGWDVLNWCGYRRFKRHWSVEQICNELMESFKIQISPDAIEDYLQKYQIMVAARHADFDRLASVYKDCKEIVLTIDGLQPEKGHETLYVVRDLHNDFIWFAEALVSSSTEEISRLINKAKEWVNTLGLNVICWMSDKQKAFVTSISSIFPGTAHRYCKNHFIRNVAEDVEKIDGHAKVQMRRKVRGLRELEKTAIETKKSAEQLYKDKDEKIYKQIIISTNIITDYCSVVRGILNDNNGGPLYPAGLKMANALEDVVKSIEYNLKTPKKGMICDQLKKLIKCINKGLDVYNKEKKQIIEYVNEIKDIQMTLNIKNGVWQQRVLLFRKLVYKLRTSKDAIKVKMSKIMRSYFRGLFVGGDNLEIPDDNLDLERWFKLPKSHERRINGHSHVGTRVVYEGPTLIPTLDAHRFIDKPFVVKDLLPYANVPPPSAQVEAIQRRRIMKQGSSKKKGP